MAHQSTDGRAHLTSFSPDPVDTSPSDQQPPGVDKKKEEVDYNSLEEALTGDS
tara:strand:- start:11003 stop:11161 length:159 start_codon:yes stop_codon:yes gene_type:complete